MDYLTMLREFLAGTNPTMTLSRNSISEIVREFEQAGMMRIASFHGEYALTTDGRLFQVNGTDLYLCKPPTTPEDPAPEPLQHLE